MFLLVYFENYSHFVTELLKPAEHFYSHNQPSSLQKKKKSHVSSEKIYLWNSTSKGLNRLNAKTAI